MTEEARKRVEFIQTLRTVIDVLEKTTLPAIEQSAIHCRSRGWSGIAVQFSSLAARLETEAGLYKLQIDQQLDALAKGK